MIVLSFVLVIVAAVTLVVGLFQTDTGLEWIWASIGSCIAAMLFLGIGVLQRRGARPLVGTDETYRPTPMTDFSHTPEGTRVSPPMPGSATTPSAQAGVTPEELTMLTGPATREPSEDIAEAESVREAVPDRPALVPKRTADTSRSTPLGTGPRRTGAEAAAEARTAEMPTASTRTPGAAAADVASSAATSQPDVRTRSRSGAKKTAARAAERTTVKGTAAKAPKKATTKPPTMAPAAKRETARRATAQDTTGQGRSQAGRSPAGPAPEAVGEAVKGTKRIARQTTGDAARAELAKIKGLGPAKQEALLREFGSIEAIQAATIEQLTSIRGIGETTAREILARART